MAYKLQTHPHPLLTANERTVLLHGVFSVLVIFGFSTYFVADSFRLFFFFFINTLFNLS